jgi:hypothetical protein
VNFSLLLPSALTALLALAIPVLIHLSRRSEHKLVDFAAIRWLNAHLRPQRKWLLQERLLLLVRLLLLIAMALLLAQPMLKSDAKAEHWIVVVPGAKVADFDKPPIAKNVRWHWLTPGYPALDMPQHASTIALSSLLRELDSQLPTNTQLTVVLPEKIAGLDGERIQLSRKVNWVVTSGAMNNEKQKQENTTVRLAVRYDLAHKNSLKYFRALQDSWQSEKKENQLIDVTLLSNAPPTKGQTLVWLASAELPNSIKQWVQEGGILLASSDVKFQNADMGAPIWRDAQGHVVMRSYNYGRGRVMQWQKALTPSEMPVLLDAQFSDKLLTVLKPESLAPSTAYAKNQLPDLVAKNWPLLPDSINSWFIGIILLLFALERFLAARKNSWALT